MTKAKTCEGVPGWGRFILHVTLNQAVGNTKMAIFAILCCSLRLDRLSASPFLFSSLQVLKGNVFVLPRSKFYHYKRFASISHGVKGVRGGDTGVVRDGRGLNTICEATAS